jgi:hypothetical protein
MPRIFAQRLARPGKGAILVFNGTALLGVGEGVGGSAVGKE